MVTVVCIRCEQQFSYIKASRGYPRKYCDKCKKERAREVKRASDRRYAKKHADRLAQKSRDWYAANRERAAAQRREYRERNAEACKRRSKEYRERPEVKVRKWIDDRERHEKRYANLTPEQREKKREYARAYYQKNRDKVLEYMRSRARLRRIARKDACEDCGGTNRLHMHHIVATKDGGKDVPENIRTLCQACHKRLHRVESAEKLGALDDERVRELIGG